MELAFSSEEIVFRDEVRAYLKNDYPALVSDKQNNGIELTKQDMIDYHKSISAKGWMGYNLSLIHI